MKATLEGPDDLYRLVKATPLEDVPTPEWFGALRKTASRAARHDMAAIRESVARGVAEERKL